MKGDVNPAQLQRKKDKAQQIKRAKAEKQDERNKRLSLRNPEPLQEQIATLEQEQERIGKLPPFKAQRLDTLKKGLQEILKAKKALGVEVRERRAPNGDSGRDDRGRGPGSKSIYWDPILNPSGHPPRGMPYQDRPRREDWDDTEPQDPSVLDIPMPLGRPGSTPVVISTAPAKTTYESAPVLRDLVKESTTLVPSAIRKKRKVATGEVEEEEERADEEQSSLPEESEAVVDDVYDEGTEDSEEEYDEFGGKI